MRVITSLAVAGAITLLGNTAQAQSKNADITGNWTFKSELDINCTFDGTAFIGEDIDGGLYCELTAHQSCPVPGSDETDSWTVRQTCQVKRDGNMLEVRATIEEFLDGNYSETYRPDDFYLWIRNKDLMEGYLYSWTATPAKWTREKGPIS